MTNLRIFMLGVLFFLLVIFFSMIFSIYKPSIIDLPIKKEALLQLLFVSITVCIAIFKDLLLDIGNQEIRKIKSDIKIKKEKYNEQGDAHYTRLLIENAGKGYADNVKIVLNNIYENNISPRKNFLPVILEWTHSYNESTGQVRDFCPKETGYLNLCVVNPSKLNEMPYFLLTQGRRVEDFSGINSGKTKIELLIFQKTKRKPLKYNVYLEWNSSQTTRDPYIKVNKIESVHYSD